MESMRMNNMSLMMNIPIIDMQKLEKDDGELKKLREACEKWGCFRVKNHGVAEKLMEEMKKVATYLLDLPTEIKKRNVDVTRGSGYTAIPINPIFENMGVHDVASSLALNEFCSQMDASPRQREIMKAYGEAAHELALNIAVKLKECIVGLSSSSTAESSSRDEFKEWRCQFKVNKLNFSPQIIGQIGLNEHTDPGFVTVLQDDDLIGGLQVMNPSAGSYVDANPLSGTFVILLGDVAHAWSNGRFVTAKHRVMCKEGKTRISVVTSIFGPREREVEAAPEFVDSDHPRVFIPFAFEHYLDTRWSTNLRTGQTLDFLRINAPSLNLT